MSEERVTGIVKWASPEKGFGFIEHEGDTYVFIPYSEIQAVGYRALIEGEHVTFVVTQGEKARRRAR
jgi:CspA family cold shock protein